LVLMLAACGGNTHLTFLDPQGPVAGAQRWHFYEVLGVMTELVAGPVFFLLPFFAWCYRYGNTGSKYTPKWEFTWALEIAAWGGPIVIVAVLTFFVWRDTHKLDPYKPQLPTIERIAQRGALLVECDIDQAPISRRLGARRAELHQLLFVGDVHPGEFAEPRPRSHLSCRRRIAHVPIEAPLPFFRRSVRRRNMTTGFNHKHASLGIGVRLSWSSPNLSLTLFTACHSFEINYSG
jgi:heme/copper-type cytochrome/quinol oxidase subunit 2